MPTEMLELAAASGSEPEQLTSCWQAMILAHSIGSLPIGKQNGYTAQVRERLKSKIDRGEKVNLFRSALNNDAEMLWTAHKAGIYFCEEWQDIPPHGAGVWHAPCYGGSVECMDAILANWYEHNKDQRICTLFQQPEWQRSRIPVGISKAVWAIQRANNHDTLQTAAINVAGTQVLLWLLDKMESGQVQLSLFRRSTAGNDPLDLAAKSSGEANARLVALAHVFRICETPEPSRKALVREIARDGVTPRVAAQVVDGDARV